MVAGVNDEDTDGVLQILQGGGNQAVIVGDSEEDDAEGAFALGEDVECDGAIEVGVHYKSVRVLRFMFTTTMREMFTLTTKIQELRMCL